MTRIRRRAARRDSVSSQMKRPIACRDRWAVSSSRSTHTIDVRRRRRRVNVDNAGSQQLGRVVARGADEPTIHPGHAAPGPTQAKARSRSNADAIQSSIETGNQLAIRYQDAVESLSLLMNRVEVSQHVNVHLVTTSLNLTQA